jgi:hypothetical protein
VLADQQALPRWSEQMEPGKTGSLAEAWIGERIRRLAAQAIRAISPANHSADNPLKGIGEKRAKLSSAMTEKCRFVNRMAA